MPIHTLHLSRQLYSLTQFGPRKVDQVVLVNHYFFNEFAASRLDRLWIIKGRCKLSITKARRSIPSKSACSITSIPASANCSSGIL
uniref:Putative ovule protein n=1 Tax=Solanum chacoense TaxID=4108 RepID=A0A0V0HB24_SOLCH